MGAVMGAGVGRLGAAAWRGAGKNTAAWGGPGSILSPKMYENLSTFASQPGKLKFSRVGAMRRGASAGQHAFQAALADGRQAGRYIGDTGGRAFESIKGLLGSAG